MPRPLGVPDLMSVPLVSASIGSITSGTSDGVVSSNSSIATSIAPPPRQTSGLSHPPQAKDGTVRQLYDHVRAADDGTRDSLRSPRDLIPEPRPVPLHAIRQQVDDARAGPLIH